MTVPVVVPTMNHGTAHDSLGGRDGHDYADHPIFDRLGRFFISFAAVYTAVVLAGLTALFLVRKSHAVRIRNFKTICATVLTLHVYLVLVLIAYPLNGLYKCWMEFWIMNILLPLGIALFQGMSFISSNASINLEQPGICVFSPTQWNRKRSLRVS